MHTVRGIVAIQQLLQEVVQLRGSWLAAFFERVPEAAAQIEHLGHLADFPGHSSARSSTRATIRRASKCSSASARACRQCRS